MNKYRTWVEISERALMHNIETLCSMLNGARFCVVLKANAYGHGMKEVAQIAGRAGIDCFAVDHIDDAIMLRNIFPSATIIVLGYTMFDRFSDAIAKNIELTLYDKDGFESAEKAAQKTASNISVHIKIETGTSRQGVLETDLTDLLRYIKKCEHVTVLGVSTHFANIEDTTDPGYATLQFSRFQKAVKTVQEFGFHPKYIHCACSAAIILYPDTHGTLVRAGISLYGLWSSPLVEQAVRKNDFSYTLEPVLQWKTRIAQIKTFPAGTPISYGLTEVLGKQSRVAVIPVGYWDGFDRLLSSTGEVLIGGYRCKVIGRICMNMMMVDVSNVPNVQKEQEVVLLGRNGLHEISAESMAEKLNTINYEVVTRINPLLPRVIVS